MSIQNLILGSLVSRGADRLLNPDRVSKNQFNLLTGGGYTGEDEDNKNKGPTTLGGIAKSGIMSLIAQAILGPVFGPLALTVGRNFMDRRQQGLGLNPFGGSGTPGPTGIMSGKVQTLDGRIVDSDSDEAAADLDARDQAFQETGDYDEYANSVTTPATATFSYDPNRDYYEGSDEQDRDNESNGDSGGGGGSSSASTAGDAADYSGPSPFRYGGLASLL